MAELVAEVNVEKESGYLYFVDQDGDISRAPAKHSTKGKREKIAKAGVSKEKGYLYFVDKQGNISRAVMQRGR